MNWPGHAAADARECPAIVLRLYISPKTFMNDAATQPRMTSVSSELIRVAQIGQQHAITQVEQIAHFSDSGQVIVEGDPFVLHSVIACADRRPPGASGPTFFRSFASLS